MGERTQYTPGTFNWVDLATTDQEAAKAFYADLLGWEYEDLPVGEDQFYSMARVDGKDVAAIANQPQPQRDAGVPPIWQSYVSVDSADDAAEKAAELGGQVHAGPFDVMEAGRMAVIQDPQGAFFMVWEPRDNIGAKLVNAHGALSWNEHYSPDPDGAAEFYGGLFGWETSAMDQMPMKYLVISNEGKGNGGMTVPPAPEVPPSWLVYFAVDDIDDALGKVQELGGTTMMGPTDIGIAKIAVASDPQGAAFALYSGQLEP